MNPDRIALLNGSPYVSYSYAYPHKTAYRPFNPPIPLTEVWQEETKDALFLYFHIPFCEMRCGFCNLFTTSNPPDTMEAEYLTAFERQAHRVRPALGDCQFARMALGGGTPTYLSAQSLSRLLDLSEELFGANLAQIPISVETSPQTATPDKLSLLRARGVDRISIGVQSFREEETVLVGRAQKRAEVETALTNIRNTGFPTLNIDLIYGLPGQTVETWEESLQAALHYRPEEIYLYPLYVRPLTGLGRSRREWDDQRLSLYRQACDTLGTAGYEQVSMRMFRAHHAPEEKGICSTGQAGQHPGPVYCTQEDGMVGIGCGARSYTRTLQYSSEYAVSKVGVRSILEDYIARPSEVFAVADYGIRLSPEEQKRRYLIYSLLTTEGTNRRQYQTFFNSDPLTDLPELSELIARDWMHATDTHLQLTPAGIERSDAIGPYLYSEAMDVRMETFTLK